MTDPEAPPQAPPLEEVDASFWPGFHWDDPRFKDDVYPWLRRMREQAPVHRTHWGLWRLSRHADVVGVLRHPSVGVRTRQGEVPLLASADAGRGLFMLQQDPPSHTRLRRLVSRAFTPRAVGRLRPRIDALVDELLDRVASQGRMDVIRDLALPVPSILICEMLGVPVEDRERFTGWTADSTFGLLGRLASPDQAARAQAAYVQLIDYFQGLIEERSRDPRDDMLSTLVRAAEDGDRLSPGELLSQSIGLLVAGFETTIGLIGNGLRELVLHPEELAKLESDPDLIDSAVEECLRYAGPVVATQRVLHVDVELSGTKIPADSPLLLCLASANRDPEVFVDPDRFDITRDSGDHVAFGGGAHYCLGANLARIEARAAIGGVVRRFHNLKLERETFEWGPSLFRVLADLPIRFDPR